MSNTVNQPMNPHLGRTISPMCELTTIIQVNEKSVKLPSKFVSLAPHIRASHRTCAADGG